VRRCHAVERALQICAIHANPGCGARHEKWAATTVPSHGCVLAPRSVRAMGPRRPREARGRRECRVLAATHGPPATRNAGGSHHRFSQIIRHSLRDGFNAYGVLSRVNGLFCHPRPRDAKHHRKLSISVAMPGPHAFAVRAMPLVSQHRHVHRYPRPACRDDRDTPLLPGRDAADQTTDLGSRSSRFLKIRRYVRRRIDAIAPEELLRYYQRPPQRRR